jgi:hypothetical protein
LEYNRHRWEECKKAYGELLHLASSGSQHESASYWHTIQCKLLEGDLHKQDVLEVDEDEEEDLKYQRSTECYQAAQSQLKRLEESNFLESFEYVPLTLGAKDTATVKKARGKKVAQPTDDNSRLLYIGFSISVESLTVQDIRKICTLLDTEAELSFTCSMQSLRLRAQLKLALVEIAQGNSDDAQDILIDIVESARDTSEEKVPLLRSKN